MDEHYLHSDLAVCPNAKHHGGWECWRIIEDNTYKCNCGCEFEWYAEDAWFILKQGSKESVKRSSAGWLDNSQVQTFFMALFIAVGIAAFFGFVMAIAIGGR